MSLAICLPRKGTSPMLVVRRSTGSSSTGTAPSATIAPTSLASRVEETFAAVIHHRSLTTPKWHFTFTPNEDRTRLHRLDSDPRGLLDLSDQQLKALGSVDP